MFYMNIVPYRYVYIGIVFGMVYICNLCHHRMQLRKTLVLSNDSEVFHFINCLLARSLYVHGGSFDAPIKVTQFNN